MGTSLTSFDYLLEIIRSQELGDEKIQIVSQMVEAGQTGKRIKHWEKMKRSADTVLKSELRLSGCLVGSSFQK